MALREWLEEHASAGAKTLHGAYQVAGQARWAEAWQGIVMEWHDGAGVWKVKGSVMIGTIEEVAANGAALMERYKASSGPGATMIMVALPIRAA